MGSATARSLVIAVAASLCCAHATDAASVSDVRAAYEATLKCLVANGNARGERLDAGDREGAARYDASARRCFDGAFRLGAALGLNEAQIDRDLDAAKASELPRMVKDRNYFIKAVATCKGLGLM